MADFVGEVPKEIGRYKVLFPIGVGSSSAVYQGIDKKTGENVALKFISREIFKSAENLACIERELRIFQRLSHKNIAKYHETIYLKDYIVIVMELLKFNNLPTSLVNVSTRQSIVLRWAKEILEALEYLHNRGICHHDIKLDNIAFDNKMQAKLFDFGLSDEALPGNRGCICSKTCGTPFYVAPEVITHKFYDGRKTDIWSFGVTIHVLACGKFPYTDGVSYKEIVANIRNIHKYIDIKVNGDLNELIKCTLTIDPKQRPTASQLLHSNLFDNAEVIRFGLSNTGNKSIAQSTVMKHPLIEKTPNVPKIISTLLRFTSAKVVAPHFY